MEWDPRKARLNARKHGVALADAVAVLEDETALTMRDPFPQDEERWITLGLDAFGGFGEHIKGSAGAYGVVVEHVRFEAALEEGIFFLC